MRTVILTAGIIAVAAAAVQAQVPTTPPVPVVPPRAPMHLVQPLLARLDHLRPALHAQLGQLEHLDHIGPMLDAHLAQLDHMRPMLTAQLAHLDQIGPRISASLARLDHLNVMPMLHDDFDDNLVLPDEAWAQDDPADSLWTAARSALDGGRETAAANLYRRIRTESRFARSAYRAPAYYWEAYVRERIGSQSELRSAAGILQSLKRDHPRYEKMGEADRLLSKINSELAEAGDSDAASRLQADARRNAQEVTRAQCPDQDLRLSVVQSLMQMPAETALPILKNVMAKKDACNAPLREQAVFVISQSRSPEATALLVSAAKTDPSPKVKRAAVQWLSQVNSEDAVDAIADLMNTAGSDNELMEAAMFALSQHRSPRATQLIRDIASRTNVSKSARKNAIFWLSQRPDAETGRFLRELYPTITDPDTKQALIFQLAQRKDAGDFALEIAMNEREPMNVRKAALFQAGQQKTITVAKLSQLYSSMTDREMRQQIIFTLSQRNESDALDKLIDIARNEKDVELRKNAIHWIGQSRDPRAIKFLTEIIG